MSAHDIDKKYVSPIDKFLFEYDASHDKSASQMKEIKKHQRLANLRDNPDAKKENQEIWKDF
jgi:hypothetical protein